MIHYHGGPITPTTAAVVAWTRRHAMVSFQYTQQIALAAEIAQSFALDNGAFSAWRSGAPVTDWSDYLAWIREWGRHPGFDWCLIPDVIEGTEADNDDLIAWWQERAGRLASVPVWHTHESLERLTRLTETFPVVALGSSYLEIGSVEWWARMAEAMGAACDLEGRPRAKLHGLRMLNPTIFSQLPLKSADSTNVARNVGLDTRWGDGPYQPLTPGIRAMVLMERIELHAACARWSGTLAGQFNLELVG